LGRCHGWQGIQEDASIAGVAPLRADAFGEPAPEILTARLRPNVQALHLAGVQGA